MEWECVFAAIFNFERPKLALLKTFWMDSGFWIQRQKIWAWMYKYEKNIPIDDQRYFYNNTSKITSVQGQWCDIYRTN